MLVEKRDTHCKLAAGAKLIELKDLANSKSVLYDYLQPLQIAQNKALRTLRFKNRYFPIYKIHKELPILKFNDVIEYKLSKPINSQNP